MNALFESLCRSSAKHPSRIAVVNGNDRLTYLELKERVERFAQALARHGIRQGSKLALSFFSEIDFVVAFFAVQQLDAVACPLNIESTDSELSQLLHLIDPELLIVSARQQEPGRRDAASWKGPSIAFDKVEDGCEAPILEHKQREQELENVAIILCTSGTTGLPKAAMLTYENIAGNLAAFREHLESFPGRSWLNHERFGNPIPLSHPYGLIMMTLMPLYLGGTTVQIPRFAPRASLKTIQDEQITFFGGVPSMYAMLNRFRQRSDYDTSSCRLWVSGGAPLPIPVADEFAAQFGTHICEGFGMLETSSLASLNFESTQRHPGSVGPFHSRMKAEIRSEQGQPSASEEVGELWVTGPNIMKGYYRNAAATAETLQDGWLRTGDIGCFNGEGYCYLKGRSKEIVIVGGHNVYPAEVESVLLEHPQVSDAAVAGEVDLTRGERLFGFVVTTGELNIDELQLGEFCRQRLSPYKIPRAFHAVSAIPRNAAGKIVRRALIEGLKVGDAASVPAIATV